jgi:hypothetical protein
MKPVISAVRFGHVWLLVLCALLLEVMKLFRANGYKTYFVTGGGQDCSV